MTVVGVAGDVRHWGLDNDTNPQFFRPYTQAAWPFMRVVARTAAAPMSFAKPAAAALARVEPDRPVSSVRTMEAIVERSVGPRRFAMLLLSAFALLALLLAGVGIVGVVSCSVAQRTREIGIRVALGARSGEMVALFVGRTMIWVAVGLAVGLGGSLAFMRLLRTLLFDVQPADPLVLGAVSVALAVIALVASWLPARRAASVDPLVALRSE